jgi:3-oxoadipate enol-lactonase
MSERPSGALALPATLDGPPGAPVLVLGNSLGTTGALWEPQLPVLTRRFRVLRYEHRGHGGSPAPPGPYSLGQLGADVLRVLDEHGVASASYAGISLGGMVGIWLAANAPDRVRSLVACCTSAFLGPPSLWEERAALVRAGGMAAVSGRVVARWFTPGFAARDPAVVAGFAAAMERDVVPEGYAGCCEAIQRMDLRPLLASVTAPALVIAGAEDPATPPWHGAVIASGIPGAALRVIRGAAHLANVSNAAEFTALLTAHLPAAT